MANYGSRNKKPNKIPDMTDSCSKKRYPSLWTAD